MDGMQVIDSENHLTGDPCPSCGAEIFLVPTGTSSQAECECAQALVLA
ncbi:MAG: hypothetical protein M3285_01525 [Actinomycetota bacterium]|nr:hypothetical protein [Actinomycetota bacterium]